ncbi:MAG: hypothetical protein KDB16_02120 [Acidimicrobiales bacterium]|nr:hypothetical protein [Acidimicrobiales bacterium]
MTHILYADRPFPDEYLDLVDGRAEVVGPDDGFDTAVGVIAGMFPWTGEAMDRFASLKVISRAGIGYDTVDVVAAAQRGIVVCNAPESPTVSTAEHTIALMLAVARELPRQTARAGHGLAGPVVPVETLELAGSTLGLVGLGRIACRVARTALALEMRVIAHDPFLDVCPVPGVELVPLAQVWASSDIVSLHAPATADTYRMVDAGSLEVMKPGVRLINCARGALIDHDALLKALESGHVAGVGLDVTDPEPLPEGHPLLLHERAIVTPHIASSTRAGRRRLFEHAIDNAIAVLEGRPATIVTSL